MRLNYYVFPDDTPENILLENGCEVICKDGTSVLVSSIPQDKRPLVDRINHCIYAGTVTNVKKMICTYGGSGYAEHYERDGSLFEVTEITLKGNNSRFKYNHHL